VNKVLSINIVPVNYLLILIKVNSYLQSQLLPKWNNWINWSWRYICICIKEFYLL